MSPPISAEARAPTSTSLPRRLRGLVPLCVLLAGCVDQAPLVGPSDGGALPARAARPVLDTAYTFFQGDSLLVRVAPAGVVDARVEVAVVRADLSVAWRSDLVEVRGDRAVIPLAALPEALWGADSLQLTAAVIDQSGRRAYASADSVAATTLGAAALRPARFHRGEVRGGGAGVPRAFALDAAGGLLYFASEGHAEIGVYDLIADSLSSARLAVPTGPVSLDYRAGRLAALIGDGTELLVLEPRAGFRMVERMLLPTLTIQTESRTVALAGSAVNGEDSSDGLGVLRVLRPGTGRGGPPVVIPGFVPGFGADSVPTRVRVSTSGRAGGDSVLAVRADGFRCPMLALGTGPFAASPLAGGPVYAATQNPASCGAGTRILRVDHPGSDAPILSAGARRNQLGEDRIGRIAGIEVSPDGSRVLVLAAGAVHVLDAELRLRGSLPVAAPGAIAWLQGGSEGSEYFGVATDRAVVLYRSDRLVEVGRIVLGPTRTGLLALFRADDGGVVAVAAPADRPGFVAARGAAVGR